MKPSDLRKLTDVELNAKIAEIKKDRFNLRLKQATGNLEKPSDLKMLRKDIARIKTILREKRTDCGGDKNGK